MFAKVSSPGLMGVVVAVSIAGVAHAGSVVATYRLSDHPDGGAAPPTYGLRLDNLFGDGATTTFTFGTSEGVFLTVMDAIQPSTESAGSYMINISGVVFGGVDTGSGYDETRAGFGTYALDFTYSVNVAPSGTGWIVNPTSAANLGTLSAIDVVGDEADFSFDLFESTGMNHFKFLQDEHRLDTDHHGHADHPEADHGYFVGRGWLAFGPDQNSPDTQDFLFIGTLVPLPGPGLLGAAGLLSLVVVRRRR